MKYILTLVLTLIAGHPATAAEPAIPLKPGPGQQLTAAVCNTCHTTDYIVMNSTFLTPSAWKAEVAKMRAAYAAPLDDQTAETVTAYLAEAYAVRP